MRFQELRIYSEVLEQGLYFKQHIENVDVSLPIKVVYPKKTKNLSGSINSVVAHIRDQKKFDLLVSIIYTDETKELRELPILMVEFSTAVKTDDHEWQRFDGAFWATFFQTPYLKISSEKKESQTAGAHFGGGSRLSLDQERYLIQENNGIMLHVDWDSIPGSEYLKTHDTYLSCPAYNGELEDVFRNMIDIFRTSSDIASYKNRLFEIYGSMPEPRGYKKIFPPKQSTRLRWMRNAHEFIIKINRFGHGLDPEKGGLALYRMVINSIDADIRLIGEFKIQRDKLTGRESYKTLFDAIGREKELMRIATDIFHQRNNVIDQDKALEIFKKGTNVGELFNGSTRSGPEVVVSDSALRNFLLHSSNSTIKNVLYYTNAIILTDLGRREILRIAWNGDVVRDHFESLKKKVLIDLDPIPVRVLDNRDVREDLITFTSVQLLTKCGQRMIATSYPDAQGDRCVLIGEGRAVKRKYLDIIALNERGDGFDLILQENKKDLNSRSVEKDIEKIDDIVDDHLDELLLLVRNISPIDKDHGAVYVGVGGKERTNVRSYDVDYHLMVSLSVSQDTQKIYWTIGVSNPELSKIFKPLVNKNNRYHGVLTLPDKLYIMN